MNIQFATFTKRKNSTARPSSYAKTASCQLKQPCNVRNPVIIVKGSDFSVAYNYAYISAWGYYYFVDDITVTTGDRFEVSLSADVLATYKTQIGSYSAFVERCADSGYYNIYVPDNYLSSTTTITNSQISSTALTGLDNTIGFYVLRTVCQSGSSSGIASYCLTSTQLTGVLSFMFDDGNFTDVISDESVKAFFNPFQYIVEIKWVPYDYDTFMATLINKAVNVRFGWWTSDQTGGLIDTQTPGCRFYANTISLPSNSYSDWRRYSDAFSLYTIYLPGIGDVQISAQDTAEGLCVTYELDILSGECLISLYSGSLTDGENPSGVLISTYKTTLTTPLQIGQLNSTAIKTAGGTASVIGDVLSFNWGRAIETAVDTAQGTLSPTPSINGTTGERYILLRNPNIKVSVNNLGSCEYPTARAGRPCFKNLTLGNLSGYIKCGNASISIPGYSADMEEVNGYLNSGFYYE